MTVTVSGAGVTAAYAVDVVSEVLSGEQSARPEAPLASWDIDITAEPAAETAPVGSLAADPALDKLEYQIYVMHSALASLLKRPGSSQEVLRMEYDRLAGMIQAHLIITRRTVADARASVGAHARDKFAIDMPGLITKIGVR